jgi:hypothetical protein
VLSFSFAADSFEIRMQSDAGEYIGQGKFWKFSTQAEDTVKSHKMYENPEDHGYVLSVSSFSLWTPMNFSFEWKEGLLQVGNHYPAKRFPFNDAYNGIDVSGDGRGCNRILWGYYVHEIAFADGKISKAAIDFVQYCEENTAKGLYGSIRYNSTLAHTCSTTSCSKVKDLIEWWKKGNENQQNKKMTDEELQAFYIQSIEAIDSNLAQKFPRQYKQCDELFGLWLWYDSVSSTYFNHNACGKAYISTLKSADRYVQRIFPLKKSYDNQSDVSKEDFRKAIIFLDALIVWVDKKVQKLQQQQKYSISKEVYRGSISAAFEIMRLYVQVAEKSL